MHNGKTRISAKGLAKLKAQAVDDLKKLHGAPPYNTWSNICYGDGIYANSLLRRYKAESISQLEQWCGYNA